MSASLHELRAEPASDLPAMRREWTELAARAGHPFATWEWADLWWRHFGAARPLRLAVCRRADGAAVAILPLYLAARRPVRVLRLLGHGPADRLGPICAPRDRTVVARAVRRLLGATDREWDVLFAECLPADLAWSGMLGAAVLRHEASPSVRIEGRSWDELLAARSANFRQQLRRRERRLHDAHTVRFRLTEDPDRLAGDFGTLVALHTARWGSGSDAFAGARRAFHTEFAAVALSAGWLRLWLLELDRRPVAGWYGFRYGDAEWFYQSGRDPGCDSLSVGFVLMAHALREATRDGMRRFHLLRGDEPYKARFADVDDGLETVAVCRGVTGRLAVRAAVAALALPPERRRWLAWAAG
jgi:CelD/BcsL family acetyltransferase involved in cellulose biosynthesis